MIGRRRKMNEVEELTLMKDREILLYILTQYDEESTFAEDVRIIIRRYDELLNKKETEPCCDMDNLKVASGGKENANKLDGEKHGK